MIVKDYGRNIQFHLRSNRLSLFQLIFVDIFSSEQMKGIFYDCDVIISCIGGRRSCSTLPTRTTLYSEATKVLLCSLVESESRKQAAALNQMRGDETSRTETNKESAEGVSQSESSGSMRQPLHLIYASTWGTKCNIIDFSFFFSMRFAKSIFQTYKALWNSNFPTSESMFGYDSNFCNVKQNCSRVAFSSKL